MKDIYDEWINPAVDYRCEEFTVDMREVKKASREKKKIEYQSVEQVGVQQRREKWKMPRIFQGKSKILN